jgi:dTDP-4-amino-4,6-dideoxygalactose transaminase
MLTCTKNILYSKKIMKNKKMVIKYTGFSNCLRSFQADLHTALDKVLESGKFVLGSNLSFYEKRVSELTGISHFLGVANGTCALHLALRHLAVGPGDEVITVPNSFVASAAAIALVGASPKFVDVRDDMNMNPDLLEKAITPKTRAILPVHLTGRPAHMEKIMEIAKSHDLLVVEDCAQAIGSKLHGRSVGSWGHAATFSCHPLKTLFAYGDAGMIATNNQALAKKLWMARSHGMPNRETCDFWSHNCRMDELQAAFLLVHLDHLEYWINERRRLAEYYNNSLEGVAVVPREAPGEYHTYQTYMIRVPKRDALKEYLLKEGVESLVHYPTPLHLQPAAGGQSGKKGDFPVAERLAGEILSLPLYPGFEKQEQDYVIEKIRNFYHPA